MADNIMDALNQAYENETDVCIINPETRTIDVPSKWRFLGVTSDEKSKRVPFKCPRYVDDIDLMDYSLYINYENADGIKDAHHITDVALDGDFITFTWLLSRQVTAYKGDVHYILCAKIVEDTEIINEWNTVPAVGTVSEGLEATSQIVDRDEDVIEQILIEIGNISTKSIHLTASQIIESTETSFKVELTPEQRNIFDTATTFKVYTGDIYPDEIFWYFIKESGLDNSFKQFFSVTNGALSGIYRIDDYGSYVWFRLHGRLVYQNEIVGKTPSNGDMIKIEEDRLSKAIPDVDYITKTYLENHICKEVDTLNIWEVGENSDGAVYKVRDSIYYKNNNIVPNYEKPQYLIVFKQKVVSSADIYVWDWICFSAGDSEISATHINNRICIGHTYRSISHPTRSPNGDLYYVESREFLDTTINASSSDTHYPSSKAVYDAIQAALYVDSEGEV